MHLQKAVWVAAVALNPSGILGSFLSNLPASVLMYKLGPLHD